MGACLTGKYALVTGAARGIGEAIARQFVAEGARVIVADIREEEGRALVNELGEAASFRPLDVTDERAWSGLADELRARPINVLVNNAGAVVSFAPLHEVTVARDGTSGLRAALAEPPDVALVSVRV